MTLTLPPQTIARFGLMRFGGFRFGYLGTPTAPLSPWTEVDPTSGISAWTLVGGETRIEEP